MQRPKAAGGSVFEYILLVHGEGAHSRSLRIREAQGLVALRKLACVRTNHPIGPPAILEVGVQPPVETACGVHAPAFPTPTAGHQQAELSTVNTYTRSLAIRQRGANVNVQNGNGYSGTWVRPLQTYGLLVNVEASAGARCKVHRKKWCCSIYISSPLASRDHPSRVFPSATCREIAVSAGITAGARPFLRLQGLAPATAGQVCHAGSLSHIKYETSASSSAARVLHGLDDVASTLL